jgi:inorganic pyrophosphatase
MNVDSEFWGHLDQLVTSSKIVIDRPRGSVHPRYQEVVYPLDYGYLEGTTAGDGAGIDVWIGSAAADRPNAILCTVDLWKRDAEIKVLIGCTEADIEAIVNMINGGEMMRCMVIRRQ